MINYSFQPIATIDTISSHSGFYAVSVVAVVVACIIAVELWKDGWVDDAIPWIVGVVSIWILTGIVSFTTGTYIEYPNEPVTGTRVDMQFDSYDEMRTSGKSRRLVHVNRAYIVYEVEEGQIAFDAVQGQAYPKHAVLYRNDIKK